MFGSIGKLIKNNLLTFDLLFYRHFCPIPSFCDFQKISKSCKFLTVSKNSQNIFLSIVFSIICPFVLFFHVFNDWQTDWLFFFAWFKKLFIELLLFESIEKLIKISHSLSTFCLFGIYVQFQAFVIQTENKYSNVWKYRKTHTKYFSHFGTFVLLTICLFRQFFLFGLFEFLWFS